MANNYSFRSEKKVLNDETRAGLPGKFIQLPDGYVHYELVGPSDGLTVVLVHGFSVPYYIWDPTMTALVDAGFQVLRYDLYGRGYSDRPSTDYSLELFNRQLTNLLAGLNIKPPIGIAGVSMGGPIAANFTLQNPNLVTRLCLIDPAGFNIVKSLSVSFIKTPLLGELIFDLLGDKVLVNGLANDFYCPERFPQYRQKYLPPMQYRGFKRALLSTARQGVAENQNHIYEQIQTLNIPTLIIWGKYDKTFPVALVEHVRSMLPAADIHIIDEAGHVPHYEQPEKVNPLLISFFPQPANQK